MNTNHRMPSIIGRVPIGGLILSVDVTFTGFLHSGICFDRELRTRGACSSQFGNSVVERKMPDLITFIENSEPPR